MENEFPVTIEEIVREIESLQINLERLKGGRISSSSGQRFFKGRGKLKQLFVAFEQLTGVNYITFSQKETKESKEFWDQFNKKEEILLANGISFLKGERDHQSFSSNLELKRSIIKALRDRKFVRNMPDKTVEIYSQYVKSISREDAWSFMTDIGPDAKMKLIRGNENEGDILKMSENDDIQKMMGDLNNNMNKQFEGMKEGFDKVNGRLDVINETLKSSNGEVLELLNKINANLERGLGKTELLRNEE